MIQQMRQKNMCRRRSIGSNSSSLETSMSFERSAEAELMRRSMMVQMFPDQLVVDLLPHQFQSRTTVRHVMEKQLDLFWGHFMISTMLCSDESKYDGICGFAAVNALFQFDHDHSLSGSCDTEFGEIYDEEGFFQVRAILGAFETRTEEQVTQLQETVDTIRSTLDENTFLHCNKDGQLVLTKRKISMRLLQEAEFEEFETMLEDFMHLTRSSKKTLKAAQRKARNTSRRTLLRRVFSTRAA